MGDGGAGGFARWEERERASVAGQVVLGGQGGWEGWRGLTQVQAVDAQTWIRGVVQPSLLPPAAGGVRVHLASCNTWTRMETGSAHTH